MGKLGVLFVHGMGHQSPDYADAMIEELRERIRGQSCAAADVQFEAAYWGDLLESREEGLLKRMCAAGDLDWLRIRRELVVSGLGDAVAYVGPGTSESIYYDAIHARVEQGLRNLEARLLARDRAPVVIIAHSLGCAVVSNYLWDAQTRNARMRGTTDLTRGDTVAGLVTMGCNLPLFTLALAPSDLHAVSLPGVRSPAAFRDQDAFRAHAGWFNFYDPDDVLGYPLKPLSASYAKAVRADVAVNTGAIWNAHTSYWTDNEVTAPVARRLAALARAV